MKPGKLDSVGVIDYNISLITLQRSRLWQTWTIELLDGLGTQPLDEKETSVVFARIPLTTSEGAGKIRVSQYRSGLAARQIDNKRTSS